MFRRDLIALLLDHPRTIHELARLLDARPGDVEDDVHHLVRTLRHSEYVMQVDPAVCRSCGFAFGPDKLGKPSKCPACRQSRIQAARLVVKRPGSPNPSAP